MLLLFDFAGDVNDDSNSDIIYNDNAKELFNNSNYPLINFMFLVAHLLIVLAGRVIIK